MDRETYVARMMSTVIRPATPLSEEKAPAPHAQGMRALLLISLFAAPLFAGCSMVMPMSGMMSAQGDPEITHSITAKDAGKDISPLSPLLTSEDWRRADAALAVALDPQGNGAAVNWDNLESGMKGSFVPNGLYFMQAERLCRSFLATLSKPKFETRINGHACRTAPGEWTIMEAKNLDKQADKSAALKPEAEKLGAEKLGLAPLQLNPLPPRLPSATAPK